MKSMFKIFFIFIIAGGVYAQQLGKPTDLQQALNELPAIPIAGKNLKFVFGGSTWIATVNGENLMAGTIESVDIDGGVVMALKQTHIWGAAATKAATGKLGGILGKVGNVVNSAASTWVATPGPEIFLDYNNAEPRATLSVASEARIAEARAAGLR